MYPYFSQNNYGYKLINLSELCLRLYSGFCYVTVTRFNSKCVHVNV